MSNGTHMNRNIVAIVSDVKWDIHEQKYYCKIADEGYNMSKSQLEKTICDILDKKVKELS